MRWCVCVCVFKHNQSFPMGDTHIGTYVDTHAYTLSLSLGCLLTPDCLTYLIPAKHSPLTSPARSPQVVFGGEEMLSHKGEYAVVCASTEFKHNQSFPASLMKMGAVEGVILGLVFSRDLAFRYPGVCDWVFVCCFLASFFCLWLDSDTRAARARTRALSPFPTHRGVVGSVILGLVFSTSFRYPGVCGWVFVCCFFFCLLLSPLVR